MINGINNSRKADYVYNTRSGKIEKANKSEDRQKNNDQIIIDIVCEDEEEISTLFVSRLKEINLLVNSDIICYNRKGKLIKQKAKPRHIKFA